MILLSQKIYCACFKHYKDKAYKQRAVISIQQSGIENNY